MAKIETFRSALLKKKAEVLSVLGIKFDTMAALERVAEDDQAQILLDEFVSLHVNTIAHDMLRDVNDALLRIQHRDYGRCQRCEERLPEKRLRAIPWARYCVACQEGIALLGEPEAASHQFESVVSF